MKSTSKKDDKNLVLKPKSEKVQNVEETKNPFIRFCFNPWCLITLSVIVLILILFLIFGSASKVQTFQRCGDATFSGYCSLKKPYFCLNETLIEEPSLCGCPLGYALRNESCFLLNGTLSEMKYFNYNVYGDEGVLYMDFRSDVISHLLSLPRYQIYSSGEVPRRDDFAFKKINNQAQREGFNPILTQIQNLHPYSKDMQAKVAVSLVQNIPYNESQFVNFFGTEVRVSSYPYQVLYENMGECESKSELLALLLKEMGFGVVLFYYPEENHEVVGIKCPIEKSYLGTGYCFIETTMPSPISFSDGRYLSSSGVGRLIGSPQIILISDGLSLSGDLDDYKDSKTLSSLLHSSESNGGLNYIEKNKMDYLREKYGLTY